MSKMTNSPIDSAEFLVPLNQAAERVAQFFKGTSLQVAQRGYQEFCAAIPLLHDNCVLISIERPKDIVLAITRATAPICPDQSKS